MPRCYGTFKISHNPISASSPSSLSGDAFLLTRWDHRTVINPVSMFIQTLASFSKELLKELERGLRYLANVMHSVGQ